MQKACESVDDVTKEESAKSASEGTHVGSWSIRSSGPDVFFSGPFQPLAGLVTRTRRLFKSNAMSPRVETSPEERREAHFIRAVAPFSLGGFYLSSPCFPRRRSPSRAAHTHGSLDRIADSFRSCTVKRLPSVSLPRTFARLFSRWFFKQISFGSTKGVDLFNGRKEVPVNNIQVTNAIVWNELEGNYRLSWI